MPLFEYILLALLGSAGSAAGGSLAQPPATALGADAIVQPNGAALSSDSAGKGEKVKNGRSHRRVRRQRHRRNPNRHGIV